MNRLALLGLALLASMLVYMAVFSVVRRPLTIGEIPAMLDAKLAYARSLGPGKIVVFAGSNGRYSHRCETIAELTGRGCANLSVAQGIGLDFQFRLIEPLLQPGDIVYLPLEYAQYGFTRSEMQGGTENVLLVHHYPRLLLQLEPLRVLRAWASFDGEFLVHGLLETMLQARGVKRRSDAESLTTEGDQRGHTRARAEPYRAHLLRARHVERELAPDAYALQVIGDFLGRMHARGIQVVGGLPTVPMDAVVPASTLVRIESVYRASSQSLLKLPGGSRFPLDCFFDTTSHLNEECQLSHSREVGRALRRWTQSADLSTMPP